MDGRLLLPIALAALSLLLVCGATRGQEAEPMEEEELRRLLRNISDRGEYAKLLAEADRALRTSAMSPSAWQYRAYALHRMGRGREAVEAYEQTTRLSPRNWWAYMNLADLLGRERRWAEAEQAARAAIDILPAHWGPRETLSFVFRGKGDHEAAAAAVEEALAARVSPVRCHQELGYLRWVLLEPEKSREHWVKASGLGGQVDVIDHGLRLLDWEREPGDTAKQKEEIARRRLGGGVEWIFDFEGIEVHTRVGPRLPPEFGRILCGLVRDQAKFLGITGRWPLEVRLHLARTQEEHELNRRREFPLGATGKGFLIERYYGRPRGSPRRRFEDPGLDIYLCWSVRGLVRGLSHELAHAMLRMLVEDSGRLPVWLDEGIATYLELVPLEDGTLTSGAVRHDLLQELACAQAADRALGWRAMLDTPRYAYTGADARARYAQAWTMVHFLVHGRSRDGRKQLRAYIDALAGGRKPPAERFGEFYGEDFDRIEADWSRHVIMLRNR